MLKIITSKMISKITTLLFTLLFFIGQHQVDGSSAMRNLSLSRYSKSRSSFYSIIRPKFPRQSGLLRAIVRKMSGFIVAEQYVDSNGDP